MDDDPFILETARDILEDAGYQIDSAGTAAEALALLEQNKADLMLVDFNLPDSSGLALAEAARKKIPGLRILLMTGEADLEIPPGAPVDDYLLKPVDPARLIALLHKTLSRP